MKNHKLFIIGLGVFVALLIGVGISLAGNPVNQQAIRYDEKRYSDFQQIKYQIDEYYRGNLKVPAALDALPGRDNLNFTDPETEQPYEYQVVNKTSYRLCTTFSTNAEDLKEYGNVYFDYPVQHTQGYSCVEMEVPAYIQNTVNTPEQVPAR